MAADFVDLDEDGNTAEKTPFDLERRPRRFDDPNTPDTGAVDPNEQPPVSAIVDMGAFEAPNCTTATAQVCDDRVWCTVESCVSSACGNDCVPRPYGDVDIRDGAEIVNMDDLLTILSAFSSTYTNCAGGVRSGCDLSGNAPCFCTPNGIINADDILAVFAAFSGNYHGCDHCCGWPGDQPLMGGESESTEALGHIGAAQVIVDFLLQSAAQDSGASDINQLLAEYFVLFVLEEYSEDEKAAVLDMAQKAADGADDPLTTDLFAVMVEALAD